MFHHVLVYMGHLHMVLSALSLNILEDEHIRGVQQKYGGSVQDFLSNTSDFALSTSFFLVIYEHKIREVQQKILVVAFLNGQICLSEHLLWSFMNTKSEVFNRKS